MLHMPTMAAVATEVDEPLGRHAADSAVEQPSSYCVW